MPHDKLEIFCPASTCLSIPGTLRIVQGIARWSQKKVYHKIIGLYSAQKKLYAPGADIQPCPAKIQRLRDQLASRCNQQRHEQVDADEEAVEQVEQLLMIERLVDHE